MVTLSKNKKLLKTQIKNAVEDREGRTGITILIDMGYGKREGKR